MADKFQITVTLPKVTASDGVVVGRELRSSNPPDGETNVLAVGLDDSTATIEALKGQKLHLELVDILAPGGHPSRIERGMRRFVVGDSLEPAKVGQLTVAVAEATEAPAAEPVPTPTDELADELSDESADDKVESPIDGLHADEAIEHIGRMRSHAKLQQIIDADERVTVRQAAQKRLDELTAG